MSTKTTLQKITSILFVLSIIAVIASVVYLSILSAVNSPSSDLQKKAVVNYVLGDTRAYDGTYNYYTGNNFMQLSLKDGKKRALTKYPLLTDIQSIYWMKNGAVFNFSREPVMSNLSNMVTDTLAELNAKNKYLNLDSPESLYWYVNFSNGEISYLTYAENPFGIATDASGDYIYFSENLTDSNYDYFGSVSSKGDVRYGIFGASTTTPSRVIGQDGDVLYIARQDGDTGKVSLLTFNLSTSTQDTRIENLYGNSLQDTVYEDIFLIDKDTLASISTNTSSTTLTKITISSKERHVIHTGPESSSLVYSGDGLFTVSDNGDSLLKTYTIDINGKNKNQSIITKRDSLYEKVLFSNPYKPILIDRPYIYMHASITVNSIDDRGIEKGFQSNNSSLERDIYSQTGDINTYKLILPSGSLKQEYEKVINHTKKLGIDIHDVTILPQLSREALYDL